MSQKNPTYKQIKQQLLRKIGHFWVEGEQLPTLQDIAGDLGVGQRNTWRAVRELVQEGYLESKPGRGTRVASCLPVLAEGQAGSSVTMKKTRAMVILPQASDRYLTDIARTIEPLLVSGGCDLSMRWGTGAYDLTQPPYSEYEAIIVLQPDLQRIRFSSQQRVVIVSATNTVKVEASRGYDLVSVDDEQGGQMAGRLLRECGAKHVAFLGVRAVDSNQEINLTSMHRLRGFEDGWGGSLEEQDKYWAKSYCITSPIKFQAVEQFVESRNRPDAVFAASDELAVGFALGTLQRDLMPGRDYQLVGFDGQDLARTLVECPPITSIAIPSEEMGRRAAQLLLTRIKKPDKQVERLLLGCELFEGRTVNQDSKEEIK